MNIHNEKLIRKVSRKMGEILKSVSNQYFEPVDTLAKSQTDDYKELVKFVETYSIGEIFKNKSRTQLIKDYACWSHLNPTDYNDEDIFTEACIKIESCAERLIGKKLSKENDIFSTAFVNFYWPNDGGKS